MKPFSGLLKPAYDETLSSWLFRCSIHPRYRGLIRGSDLNYVNWRAVETGFETDDIDFNFEVSLVKQAIHQLGLSHQHVECTFSIDREHIVEWDYRRFYCAECLRCDVAKGRLPSWQKSWCRDDAVQCQIHHCDLDTLLEIPRPSRAWDGFVQSANTVTPERPWNEPGFSRLRALCCNKIRCWISDLRRRNSLTEAALFHRLYSIFVQAPYRGTGGGAARLYFTGPYARRISESGSFEESLRLGAMTAEPSVRFGGLLFAGALLDIIPESILFAVEKYFPGSKQWSLVSGQCYGLYMPSVDRKGYKFLHQYLGQFQREKWVKLDKFLAIQELRYYREGIHTGIPLSRPSSEAP